MDEKRRQILDEILKLAAFEGWNDKSLERAAQNAGFEAKYAYVLFPEGIKSLTSYFAKSCDTEMEKNLGNAKLNELRIRDRIAEAVMTRLRIYDKNKEAIRTLIAYYALPENSLRSMKNIARTVDKMWYAAGDNSNDYNYYTKRLLLSGVYTSTILYWLNDDSKDLSATKEFLKRRIEDVMQFQKMKSKAKELSEKLKNAIPFKKAI